MTIKLRRASITRDRPGADAKAQYKEEIAGFVVEQAVQFADL